jgi:hypothetical protein
MLSLPLTSKPIAIYIDADACPVKQEVYRIAERHALKGTLLKVLVVSNSRIAGPRRSVLTYFRHPEVRAKRASKGDGRGTRAASFGGRFAAASG